MKKLILIFTILLTMFASSACTTDKASILFNKYPITEKNIYDYSKSFLIGRRIYYVVLMPKKVESRYLYIQIIKKDNNYGQYGYKLQQTFNIRLKDEEVNYYTDYFVLNEKGFYIMKVFSKDRPQKVLAQADFYVAK